MARAARDRVLDRAEQRVADAVAAATIESARLAQVCGSADAAAEILGTDVREIRRAITTAERSRASS